MHEIRSLWEKVVEVFTITSIKQPLLSLKRPFLTHCYIKKTFCCKISKIIQFWYRLQCFSFEIHEVVHRRVFPDDICCISQNCSRGFIPKKQSFQLQLWLTRTMKCLFLHVWDDICQIQMKIKSGSISVPSTIDHDWLLNAYIHSSWHKFAVLWNESPWTYGLILYTLPLCCFSINFWQICFFAKFGDFAM